MTNELKEYFELVFPQKGLSAWERLMLLSLLDTARSSRPTPEQRETQRPSFVYGNTHLENELITREMVDRAAEIFLKENGR